jgi:hypothetical protein
MLRSSDEHRRQWAAFLRGLRRGLSGAADNDHHCAPLLIDLSPFEQLRNVSTTQGERYRIAEILRSAADAIEAGE